MCGGAEWCSWCANAYALNRPAADGLVYCGGPDPDAPAAEYGCGRYLPDLATLVARGLAQYPLYCGECRDAETGAELPGDGRASTSGVTGRAAEERPSAARPVTPEPEPGPTPKPKAEPFAAQAEPRRDAEAHHLRGGFRPRPATGRKLSAATVPEPTYESEMGTGPTAHPLHGARELFGDGWGR
ncbi:hypothetical protein PP1_007085 [Pseudonocardia sp. P1]|nr:hypothetical protein Ae707Ps1_1854 [Pseudonocardia sp. Ae707_Ps1]